MHWDSEGLSLIRFTAGTSSAFWQQFSPAYTEYLLTDNTVCPGKGEHGQ